MELSKRTLAGSDLSFLAGFCFVSDVWSVKMIKNWKRSGAGSVNGR